MLTSLSLQPCDFAYDRPSPKLIAFLRFQFFLFHNFSLLISFILYFFLFRNHFNLNEPDYQPNRFVIYSTEGYII